MPKKNRENPIKKARRILEKSSEMLSAEAREALSVMLSSVQSLEAEISRLKDESAARKKEYQEKKVQLTKLLRGLKKEMDAKAKSEKAARAANKAKARIAAPGKS